MNERLKTHSKTQKKSADLVSNKLRIGVFHRYQMKCKSVSKKSPRYISSKVNPAGDLVQLPNMSVLELDPGSSPAGITDKLIIDATTPVAPDNRGHYSQPVVDLPETKAWAEKLTAMLAARK